MTNGREQLHGAETAAYFRSIKRDLIELAPIWTQQAILGPTISVFKNCLFTASVCCSHSVYK